MTPFRSCHLIVNRKLVDDRRHLCDFIDTDFFIGKVLPIYFWNALHPQTLTFFLVLMFIWEKC